MSLAFFFFVLEHCPQNKTFEILIIVLKISLSGQWSLLQSFAQDFKDLIGSKNKA